MAFPDSKRRVKVEVAAVRPQPTAALPAMLCLMAVLPPGMPRLSSVLPDALIKDSRSDSRDSVEHLRLESKQDIHHLPGLMGIYPSRLRDSVLLAFQGGAPYVDVLAVQCGERAPWEIDHPEVLSMMEPFLNEMLGALLVMPDAGRPVPIPGRTTHPDEPTARLIRLTAALRQPLEQRYQIALIDSGIVVPERFISRNGADIALCAWRGMPQALQAHQWRCGAALVGGMLSRRKTSLFEGVAGQTITLPPGRRVLPNLMEDLEVYRGQPQVAEADPQQVCLTLDTEATQVRIDGEATCRRPAGSWSLPALRTLKALHHQIVRSASLITFQPVNAAYAYALQIAIEEAMRPFVKAGVLVGQGGVGAPTVVGSMIRDPEAPGLAATISAQVRPWCRSIQIRVGLRSGSTPDVEIKA